MRTGLGRSNLVRIIKKVCLSLGVSDILTLCPSQLGTAFRRCTPDEQTTKNPKSNRYHTSGWDINVPIQTALLTVQSFWLLVHYQHHRSHQVFFKNSSTNCQPLEERRLDRCGGLWEKGHLLLVSRVMCGCFPHQSPSVWTKIIMLQKIVENVSKNGNRTEKEILKEIQKTTRESDTCHLSYSSTWISVSTRRSTYSVIPHLMFIGGMWLCGYVVRSSS